MNLITNKVADVIEPQGYQKQVVDSTQDYASLFIGEQNAYMVMYNPIKKLVALKVCGVADSAPDNQWKSMNTWIFDPETDGIKEANSIGNDFAQALSTSKPKLNKSKKKNSDDGNADPKFFCKRLVNIFPELKEEVWEEEDSYEVITDPDDFDAVLKALQEAGIPMVSSEVTMIPQNYVELTDETSIKNLQKTLDLLDEDDDVQAVYHNWDE